MDPLSLCLSNEWLPFAEQLEMIAFNVFNCSTYTWRCLPTSFYMLAIDWTAKNRSKLFANNRLKTYNQIFNKEGFFVFFKFCRQRRKTVKLQSQHSNIYLYSTQKDADYICHSVKLSTCHFFTIRLKNDILLAHRVHEVVNQCLSQWGVTDPVQGFISTTLTCCCPWVTWDFYSQRCN